MGCTRLVLTTTRPRLIVRVGGIPSMPAAAVASVFGRTGAVVAAPGDYTAAQVGAEVAGASTAAVAAHVGAADPHAQYTTDAEAAAIATTSASAALTAHTSAPDPHSQYTTDDEAQRLAIGLFYGLRGDRSI